jgi:hypothetical protein
VAAFILCIGFFWTPLASAFVQEDAPVGHDASATQGPSADMSDIYDLKALEPPQGTPFFTKLLLAVAGVLVSILIAWAVHRYYRKKNEDKQKTPSPVPPDQAAYDALREIRELMDSDGKAFYYRLSIALRDYIGKRFSVNAAEMTTQELFPVLRSLPLDTDLESEVRRFLLYSDPVKYAGTVPERVKMERHLKFVRFFVKKTTDAISPEADGSGEDSHAEKVTNTN